MPESYAICQKCDAKILDTTAREHGGICARCAKRKAERWRRWLMYALTPIVLPASLFGMFVFLLMIPFLAIYSELLFQYRKLKFPFSINDIEYRIKNVFPNVKEGNIYIRALVTGFFESDRNLSITELDSIPTTVGFFDGRHLADGTIEFGLLPDKTMADSYRRIVG